MEASSGSTIADSYYFTVHDLARAFAPITGADEAEAWARAWATEFADCVSGDRIVALPPSYRAKRLDERDVPCELARGAHAAQGLNPLYEPRLLRFAPGTLTLVAAANSEVRKRFDRLKIPYGWATIDDPVKWKQLVEFLKNP